MYIAACFLLPFLGLCWAQSDPFMVYGGQQSSENSLDDGLQLILGSRDAEQLPQNSLYGHKYVAGGAGEGKQFLKPSGSVPNKEEVKTDSILPAYCEPPNPCPPGMTSEDGCTEEFENTAEFSRQYQESQQCMCDEEHMFSCPQNQHRLTAEDQGNQQDGAQASFADALERFLDKQNIAEQHKSIRAKKFHQKKRSGSEDQLSSDDSVKVVKKRSVHYNAGIAHHQKKPLYNPYWMQGDKRVHIVAKKG